MIVKGSWYKQQYLWHPWFAWRPIFKHETDGGDVIRSVTIWLSWIERRRVDSMMGWYWEYRLPQPGVPPWVEETNDHVARDIEWPRAPGTLRIP